MKREGLLDLNDVLQHPGRKLSMDISTEFPADNDLELVGSVDGFIDAISTGNLLLISGDFTAICVLDCARCGGPLEVPIEFSLDEQFPVQGIPSSYSATDFARVAADEPYELFEENSLMVEVLLRQNLLISFPVQPLCSHGWEGDCPIARARGVVLNVEPGGDALTKLKVMLESQAAVKSSKKKSTKNHE